MARRAGSAIADAIRTQRLAVRDRALAHRVRSRAVTGITLLHVLHTVLHSPLITPVATGRPSPTETVFLSYASADRDRARLVVNALEAEGLTVWWDQRMNAGEVFDETIERHLDGARVVVVLWSPAAASSRWMREEAGRARDRKILVPPQIAAGAIPLGFGMLQAAPCAPAFAGGVAAR